MCLHKNIIQHCCEKLEKTKCRDIPGLSFRILKILKIPKKNEKEKTSHIGKCTFKDRNKEFVVTFLHFFVQEENGNKLNEYET